MPGSMNDISPPTGRSATTVKSQPEPAITPVAKTAPVAPQAKSAEVVAKSPAKPKRRRWLRFIVTFSISLVALGGLAYLAYSLSR